MLSNAHSYLTTGITLALMAIAAEVTYIVMGPQDLEADVTVQEPAAVSQCGDGVLQAGERCDDGNVMVLDGCTRCQMDPGFLCVGQPSLCGPFDGMVSSQMSASSLSSESSAGSESSVSSETSSDSSESSSSFSSSPSSYSSPAPTPGSTASQAMRFNQRAVRAPYSSSSAPTETVQPASKATGIKPSCGDGLVLNEACDDGNLKDADGCSAACAVESGYICAGNPSTCSIACGDGIIAGEEKCDDGGNNNGDGCSSTCFIEPNHSCKGSPSTCTVNAYCGDGVTEGNEACDDANSTETDGCTSTCTKSAD